MIGINPDFDCLFDPQQARPAGWCRCGREIWADDMPACTSCMKEMEDEEDEPFIF